VIKQRFGFQKTRLRGLTDLHFARGHLLAEA
jgi:hypothetical protein